MSAAYSITELLEVLQSPSNTQSGANTTATPNPMKITMNRITKIWNMHTYRDFSLQIPQIPSPAPPMMVRASPRLIPSMVHLMEVFPRKIESLMATQTVPQSRATPKARMNKAPRVVKHFTSGFINGNIFDYEFRV